MTYNVFGGTLNPTVFLRSGVTIACFCDDGNRPSRNEALIIAVTNGNSTSIGN